MKVTFEYIPTDDGHKLQMSCEDIPTLPGTSVYDNAEYYKCFRAIKQSIDETISNLEGLIFKGKSDE